jgi:hypothetical protein
MDVKSLRVEPISATDARRFVRRYHYSGKVDPRSQLHLGVFSQGRLEGAMQFGPSIDKSKALRLVTDTSWNGYLELNRLAFSDRLPKNSESRAIGIAIRLIKQHTPHIQWILSYADGTQCGDGTIYRASGFLLIGVKKNTSMWRMPDGEVHAKIVFEPGFSPNSGQNSVKARYGKTGSGTSTSFLRSVGAECLTGFQLRYIRPLHPTVLDRLTVPVLPFSAIDEAGARMYRGTRAGSVDSDAPTVPVGEGGASPTSALQGEDDG